MLIYTIKPGDNLYSIAKNYGIDVQKLIDLNQLDNPNQLSVGQDILIPVQKSTHVVVSGDSLYSIALQHSITVNEILAINPALKSPYIIMPGQIINIPNANVNKPQIEVNGYAYPTISATVLQQTLPYLTYLSIFSYKVTAQGELVAIEDDGLIGAARRAKVAPIMVITNTGATGGFDSDLVDALLNNMFLQDRMIKNIMTTLAKKEYYGLNVDFEYIKAESKEKYNEFLIKLGNQLRKDGYILMTAVAPKLSADQSGTLYEAHDYPAHGKSVDRVIIMTYEWGYLYGPPLAIAPVKEVEKVIKYAVTEIPSKKILMGMPNYAYDWKLPYKKGSAAKVLTIAAAERQAYKVGAKIEYNENSQAPFYQYYDETGTQHIVWFDNPRSTKARLKLVNDYNLGGVSYWTINQFFKQNWLLLDSMFNIKKLL